MTATENTPDRWEDVAAALVAERGDALTRYAYFISGNREDAADLVHDALLKTFGRLHRGFTISYAEAYVRRAILNSYLDRGRRITRWRAIAHLTASPDIQPAPDDQVGARLDIQSQLMRLRPRERACLVLRYYEDLTVDDIATTLKISAGAVKRYLSDALARMADGVDRGNDDA
ncbi:MAG: RNA polymerase sigma factor [Rhodoglobus sp.]